MPKISPITANKLRKVFEKVGFRCVRIEGDHYVYTKAGITRPVVIPDWKEIPVFIIKDFKGINKFGVKAMTPQELLEELK